jgi:hypothetical protein
MGVHFLKTLAILFGLLLFAPVVTLAGEAPAPKTGLVLERVVTIYPPTPEPVEDGADAPEAPGPVVTKMTIRMAGNRLRQTSNDGKEVVIVRYDKKLLWLLNTAQRTYSQVTFAQAGAATARARKRLIDRLPLIEDGQQRELLRKLLGAGDVLPRVAIERPGGSKVILGEKCWELLVKIDGEIFFKGWTSQRKSPMKNQSWLLLGNCLDRRTAAKLGKIKSLLLEAEFPMADGGRMTITTVRLTEEEVGTADFSDPARMGYKNTGDREKPGQDKKSTKPGNISEFIEYPKTPKISTF